MSILLSTLRKVHDSNNEEYFAELNPSRARIKPHESWQDCKCLAAQNIRERSEETYMDEDSPNNMLTPEEHILLFNKCLKKDENTSTEEIIATRQLMKRGIAVIRTKVQAKTVILNERRNTASRKEKEAIAAADKQYVPKLRPSEKASDEEIKLMVEINENPRIQALLKALPGPAYKSVLSMIKQLGLPEVIKMLKWDVKAPEKET